jgi:hypothetical protein
MRKKYISIFGLIMVGILLMNTTFVLCDTQFLYILPTDDAYGRYDNPTTVYNDAMLFIYNSDFYRSYGVLKFDISSLSGQNIISAKLRFVPILYRKTITFHEV